LFSTAVPCLGQLPPPVSISDPPLFRPKAPGEIKTVEDAMAAVITVTSKDLGLPLVKPLYLHLHKDTNDFAANAGKYGRRLSPEVVKFAVAVAEENRFHVNMEKTRGRPWSALIWTLAHEYAHNVEYVFSSVNRGPQWIREGFADWVAAKVVDSLGWLDYSISTHRANLEVRRQTSSLPRLSELEDSSRWSVWANGATGSILTYRLAFLAVDKLMARGGVPAIQKYFATQDFRNHFGISWNDFEKEFKAGLLEAQLRARSLDGAEKPEWKVGYQWLYEWKSPGRRGTLNREIDREEMVDGLLTYVLRAGNSADFLSRETLGLIATASQEKLLTKRSGPHEFFSWPLTVGKEWRTSFVVENIAQKTSQKLAYVKVIAGVEEVKVPAGMFEALKIETYGTESGILVTEQWYAPKARWFVKTRSYLQDGVREEELASFKFD
jgi:hypothetical protein